jgi:molybdopterin-guanine dinucleotide biosynthesis protein A
MARCPITDDLASGCAPHTVKTSLSAADITLGLLAGGRGSRLGGADKAWLTRDGVPQVVRWSTRFAGEHGPLLVSANRDSGRHAAHGFRVVPDRRPDLGPIGGLDALAADCATPWLFTLPVDLVGANDCLLRTLLSLRGEDGAFAIDDDGPQPLAALWRRDALRTACVEAIAANETAVHLLRKRLDLPAVVFSGFRFGNLNTPDDLHTAGIVLPESPSP